MNTIRFKNSIFRDPLNKEDKVRMYKRFRKYVKDQLIYVSEHMSVVDYVLNREKHWQSNKTLR